MADIIQKLGFDAAAAIAELNQVTNSLNQFNRSISNAASALRAFNSLSGGKGLNQLNQTLATLPRTASQASDSLAGISNSILAMPQGMTATSGAVKNLGDAFTLTRGKTDVALSRIINLRKELNIVPPASNSVKTSVQEMAISFDTLFKVMQFRAAIAGIQALTGAMAEGVKSAADFSAAMGRIMTVAEPGANFTRIKDSLISLSAEFAKPLPDVTSAYYLTLQNQVGDSAESLNVLTRAAQLSRITGSSLTNAVDTLTVTLNGFGLSAAEAGDVSGKLFKAVEIGRFNFEDMSDTMGRVIPIAKELRVGIEEILGPIATMTRNGVGFNTAVTQMRAVITQLLKPTQAMQAIFKQWGVVDVQEAILKFGGLIPLLSQLQTELGGNSSKLSEAFTNVRAFTGAMSILGKNTEDTIGDIRKIRDATTDVVDGFDDMVKAMPGQRFAQIINQMKVDMTKFGESALPATNLVLQGLQHVTSEASKIAPILIGIGGVAATAIAVSTVAAFTKWLGTIAITNTALKVTLATTRLLGFAAAGFAVGQLLGESIGNMLPQVQKLRELTRRMQQDAVDGRREIKARYQEERDQAAQTATALIDGLTKISKSNQNTTDVLKASWDATYRTIKGHLTNLLQQQNDFVKEQVKLQTDAAKRIRDLNRQIADEKYNQGQRDFDQNLKRFTAEQQQVAQQNRAIQQMAEARQALRKAATPEDFANVAKQLDQASQTASLAGERGVNLQKQISQAKVDTYKKEQDLAAVEQKNAKARYDSEVEREVKMKELIKTILDGYSAETKVGTDIRKKTQQELDEGIAKSKAAFLELQNIIQEGGTKGVTDLFGLKSLRQNILNIGKELPALQVTIEFQYQESLAAMKAETAQLPAALQQRGQVTGSQTPTSSAISEATKLIDKQKELSKIAEGAEGAISDLDVVIRGYADALNQASRVDMSFMDPGQQGLGFEEGYKELVTNIRQQFNELKNIDPLDDRGFIDKLNKMSEAINAFKTKVRSDLAGEKISESMANRLFGDFDTAITKSFENINQRFATLRPKLQAKVELEDINQTIQTIQNQIDQNPLKIKADLEEQEDLKRELLGLPKPEIAPDLTGTLESVNIIKESLGGWVNNASLFGTNMATAQQPIGAAQSSILGLSQAVTNLTSLALNAARAFEAMAQAAAQAQAAGASAASTALAAKGGILYRAGGGWVPRGTDTRPAMLTAGEMVIQAKHSRQFYSQLQAINAGMTPNYRQHGGQVVNIGDINLNVSGDNTPKQNVREMITAIRRELKRETSRL